MMMKIKEIWDQLENDNSFSTRLLLRRYSGTILPDVFVAFQNPEKIRCIAALISNHVSVDLSQFANLRDISIEVLPDEGRPDKKYLLFKLLNSQHNDVFAILCEDLMISIEKITSETELIKELFNRFEKWKSLFDIAAAQGLSFEEQRGLYGELVLLRTLLDNFSDKYLVIESWKGSERQSRDFQYQSWAIEVKTTYGKNHQKIHINNERQLDGSNFSNLYLFHLSLEVLDNSGESLNEVIDALRNGLHTDIRALNRFNSKLFEGGYFDHHSELYRSVGYLVRKGSFFLVAGDFPRIEESDLRDGVGDVQYTIILSTLSCYAIPEQQVIQTISF
jgi:hypothetical protein